MEHKICAALLSSREAYDKVESHLNKRELSPLYAAIYEEIAKYYTADPEVKKADPDVIRANLESSLSSSDMVTQMHEIMGEILSEDISETNIVRLVLNKKIRDIGQELAQCLLSQDKLRQAILLEQYSELLEKDSLEVEPEEEYIAPDLEELMAAKYDPDKLIKIPPKSLANRLGGGVNRGHHVILAARPEAGKTATAINIACGVAFQGFRVLYYANEEPISDIIVRAAANLSGLSFLQVKQEPQKAYGLAMHRGFENMVFVYAKSNTLWEIRSLVKRHEPDLLIVDQIRNLNMRVEGKTELLEIACKGIRAIAAHHNCAAISITQAGESAQGKAVLSISDIDSSKTGVQGACDVMIMVGVSDDLARQGRRCVTLAKNKISGDHSSWYVNINEPLSRITDNE